MTLACPPGYLRDPDNPTTTADSRQTKTKYRASVGFVNIADPFEPMDCRQPAGGRADELQIRADVGQQPVYLLRRRVEPE